MDDLSTRLDELAERGERRGPDSVFRRARAEVDVVPCPRGDWRPLLAAGVALALVVEGSPFS